MNKIKRKTIPFEDLKAELMKNPEFVREYEKLEPQFQIVRQILDAKIKQKLSTKDIAKKAGVSATTVSRLEGMNANPSIALLQKIAQALNTKITITV